MVLVHEPQGGIRSHEVREVHQVNPILLEEWQSLALPLEIRISLLEIHP